MANGNNHYPEILRIRELETLARILANQYNLRLEFGPPASAPGVIYLPLFTTDMFKPPFARRMIGMLDHEAAHHLYTDFEMAKKVFPHLAGEEEGEDVDEDDPSYGKNKKGAVTDATPEEGLLKYLWNVWEDGMIERKIQLEFLGAKDNLADSNSYIISKDAKNFGKNFLSDALFYICYTNKGCDEIPVTDEVIKFCEAFDDLRLEGKYTQSTAENYDLAVRTLDRLKQLMPDDLLKEFEMDKNQSHIKIPKQGKGQGQQQDQQGGGSGMQGQQQQSGQSGKQQGKQSGQSGDQQQDGGQQGKNKQQSGQQQKDKSQASGAGKQGKSEEELQDAMDKAKDLLKKHSKDIRKDLKESNKMMKALDCISRKLRKALEKEFEQSTSQKGAGRYASDVPFSVFFDQLDYINDWTPQDKKRYEGIFEEVRSECKSLRPKFIMGIRGYGEGRLDGHKKYGCKIDTRNLSRLVTENETHIFAQWKEDITSDMAISLILDESGSMNSDEAAKVMLAVAEPLSYTEAKVLIASYEGSGWGHSDLGRNVTHIRVYKNFDERFQRMKFRFGKVSSRGSTPIPQALDFGYLSLVTRPEKRKLLILVTDGDSDGQEDATPLIRKREAAMREQGVELVAVVLMAPAYAAHYKKIFPHLVCVVPGEPVAPVFVKMLNDYFKPQLDVRRRQEDEEEEN